VSQSPWTLPSFASILTGLLPSSHRAGEGTRFAAVALDPSHETLATTLSRAGYRTASFVSNPLVGRERGMARGFDDHEVFLTSRDSANAALTWLEAHGRERFFLFLHIVDPHQPYAPTAEDATPFIDPAYRGPVGLSYGGFGDPNWTDADKRRVIDLYDGEVHYADRLLGHVLDELAALGVYERTLVIVLSDHGEELFERGTCWHGHTLYDELLIVPFVLHLPGAHGERRIATQVRLMDVYPTVLDALGLPVPAEIDAVSLWPLIRAGRGRDEPALAEFLRVDPERKAIRKDRMKLILTPASGEMHLYDLRADPGEQRDMVQEKPTEAAALRTVIETRVLARLEGFHLLLRGGIAAHDVQVRIRSERALTDVALVNQKGDDGFTLSDDGRVADVRLHLAARRHWPRLNMDTIDDVGVRFRTTDGAPMMLQLLVDGASMDGGQVALGTDGARVGGPPPWRFEAADARLVVPFPEPPAAPDDELPRARLVYVHRPPPPVAPLDERTRENLRALGYVD